eukprot:165747-Prymnesium_polylepis.1
MTRQQDTSAPSVERATTARCASTAATCFSEGGHHVRGDRCVASTASSCLFGWRIVTIREKRQPSDPPTVAPDTCRVDAIPWGLMLL